ncbi:ComEC/Rec2 family competence protein [Pedobacter sp.]|uniref:ComEC/Rec2 family competence protein n=1 Tax=Pedobacter sp. TaxID=1411316 RepID=UPI003D7F99E9
MNARAETIYVNLMLFLMTGIFTAYQFSSLTLFYFFTTVSILLFSYLLLQNLGYKKFRTYRHKILTASLSYLLTFCVGGSLFLFHQARLQPDYFAYKKLDKLIIMLEESPQWKASQLRFKAKVIYGYQNNRGIPYQGRVLVTLHAYRKTPKIFKYGDQLMLPANYTEIEEPQNPSEFDFKGWLALQNIHHQVYLDQQYATLIKPQQGNAILAFAFALRERQIRILEKLLPDQEAFSVASTLILGYRADLSQETWSAYSKTGTIHALSVSGMHVGIIYVVLNWMLGFMDRRKSLKIMKAVLIICLIWFYALLTGFSPSVLRSAIMLSTFIVAKAAQQHSNSYNILAFSAFVLLVGQPSLLFDVGFQLSYLAVFGLIYLQPIFYQLLYFKFWWADQLWKLLALSLAAQLATFPLSVYYFHQFPVYFLVSNLFIMLPAALMMYLGLSLLLFKLYFLAPILQGVITFTNKGLKYIADLPFSTFSAIWWNKTELLLMTASLIFIVWAFNSKRKEMLFLALLSFLLLQTSSTFHELQAQEQQKVIVFKLRKNKAAVYIQSTKAFLFTDLDVNSKTFQYSIKPCLDQHRVKALQIENVTLHLKKIQHLW